MKKIIFFSVCAFFLNNARAQVGGISDSKLGTICTEAISKNTIEFESAFGTTQTNQYWDKNGKLFDTYQTSDSMELNSDLGFRFTYGAFENFEIGIALPADVSAVSWGMKYKFLSLDKLSFGAMFGLNTIFGNTVYNKSVKTIERTPTYAAGLASTYQINDDLSVDCDVQYQAFTQKIQEKHTNDLFINLGVGYFIKGIVQPIIELNYGASNFDNSDVNLALLTLNPGVTIETAERFMIVLNTPIDISGKNTDKTTGLGFALTIMLD